MSKIITTLVLIALTVALIAAFILPQRDKVAAVGEQTTNQLDAAVDVINDSGVYFAATINNDISNPDITVTVLDQSGVSMSMNGVPSQARFTLESIGKNAYGEITSKTYKLKPVS